jgi:hydrogenase nickel incorporation protein HypB
MCTVCGCGGGKATLEGGDRSRHLQHEHNHPSHPLEGDLSLTPVPCRVHAPGLSQRRRVQIEQDILSKNDRYAQENRRYFQAHGIWTLNLVSGPGAGKTALLVRTLADFKGQEALAVIEGDQQTSNDAERIRATGVPALQINTGKGCHLDAHMVGHALERLEPQDSSLLFIENVGNLVCPAAFDLGEAHKVAILSVTEGEDKPLKYPDMFHAASLMLLNKVDLLPYLDFEVARCLEYAHRINPNMEIIELSTRTGAGMVQWYTWIKRRRAAWLNGEAVLEYPPALGGESLSGSAR